MALFENFPYTNMHELNLDWIIKIIEDFNQKYPGVITEINNKLDKAINGNGAFGDILTSNGDGTVSWTSSKDIDPEIIADAVFEWLDEHPEATTTVEDGSITEAKLAWSLNKQIKSSNFVDNIHLRTGAFISSDIDGYTAVQGMCCINNRYLVQCRYYNNNTQRAFRVYDIINKSFVNESILDESQVGHVNSMAYSNGYLYVTTLAENKGIVRLTVNLETFVIAFDTIVNPDIYASISIYGDNIFAWKIADDDRWHCYRLSTAFAEPVSIFDTDFLDSMSYVVMQGGTADENYIYVAMSGKYDNGTTTANDSNPITRYTEYIYVFTYAGELVKTFNVSRGIYGEIEDIAIITVLNQKYIAVTFNQNETHVANIFVAPLLNSTQPINQFMTTDIKNSVNKSDTTDLLVFVSASTGTEFADGTENKPFKSINSAISFIKRADIPCSLIIKDGTFLNLIIHNIAKPLTVFWNGGEINNVYVRRCGAIVFDVSATTTRTVIKGSMTLDEAIVLSRSGPDFTAPNTLTQAIRLVRSLFIGSIARNVTNYTYAVTGVTSMVAITISSGVTTVNPATLFGWVNGTAINH